MSIEPGWYPDPAEPGTQRYWDGEGWLGDPLPADATAPDGPPPEPAAAIDPVDPRGPVDPDTTMPPVGPAPAYYPYPPYRLPPPAETPGQSGDKTAESTAQPTYPPYPFPYYPPIPLPPPNPSAPQYQPPAGNPYPPIPYGYAYPPAATVARPHGLPLAAPQTRLLARLIDLALLGVLALAVNGYLIWKLIGGYSDALKKYEANEQISDTSVGNYIFLIVLLTAALWAAYEIPQLANNGQTVGKRLMGIRVMRLESDQPLGLGRSFRRWWGLGGATLLWPCFGAGFLIQFVDCLFVVIDRPLGQALHDKRAATVVVRVGRGTSADPTSRPSGDTTGSDLPGGRP